MRSLAVSTLKTAQEISFVSTGAEDSLQAVFYQNFRANRCQPSLEEVLVTYAKTHSAEMETVQNAWHSLMNDFKFVFKIERKLTGTYKSQQRLEQTKDCCLFPPQIHV